MRRVLKRIGRFVIFIGLYSACALLFSEESSFETGERLFRAGDEEGAIPYLESAIRNAENGNAYTYLALCYEAVGQNDAALDVATQGMRVNGTDKKVLAYNAGNLCFKSEDYEAAERWYSLSIAVNPLYAPPVLNRANAKLKQQKYNSSLEDYKLYLDLSPADSQKTEIERLIALLEGYKQQEEEARAQEQALEEEQRRIEEQESLLASQAAAQAQEAAFKKAEEAEQRASNLEAELNDRKSELEKLRAQASLAEQQQELAGQKDALQEQALKEKEERIQELESEISDQEEEIERLKKERDEALASARASGELTQQRLEEEQKKTTALQEELDKQKAEIERLLEEQKSQAAAQAQNDEIERHAKEDSERRRRLLEDVAASLRGAQSENIRSGAEDTSGYDYEAGLE